MEVASLILSHCPCLAPVLDFPRISLSSSDLVAPSHVAVSPLVGTMLVDAVLCSRGDVNHEGASQQLRACAADKVVALSVRAICVVDV